MKKLVSLFLWFCAATFIAQLCVIGLSFMRGNVDRKTLVQIVALLNGIDIQGKRLTAAMASARNVPVPTYDDVLNAKVQASLELDTLSASLERDRQKIEEARRELKIDSDRFAKRVEAFRADFNKKEEGSRATIIKETQQIIEMLPPEAAKTQLLTMLENDQKADVVAIIKGLAPDKQKKILGEFASADDQEKLSQIIAEIKKGEPLKSLFENTKRDMNLP